MRFSLNITFRIAILVLVFIALIWNLMNARGSLLFVDRELSTGFRIVSAIIIDLILISVVGIVLLAGRQLRLDLMNLSKITRKVSLGDLTKEIKTPVLLLHQLNRDSERENRFPQLSDLRDSGAIEQDADMVMFVHRPNFKKRDATEDERREAVLIIAKQRNGPVGHREAIYEAKYTLFQNKAHADQEFEV